MSHENVANIERAYQAVSRFDADALVALCQPDVEFRSRVGEADAVTYRGHDGVRDYIATLSEVFAWVRTEPLEVIDEGDRAVVCNRFRARGRLSEVKSRTTSSMRSDCAVARRCGGTSINPRPMPSKPCGCVSRRCRRRTSS
jgi:ketosteroid isomerase-like protein